MRSIRSFILLVFVPCFAEAAPAISPSGATSAIPQLGPADPPSAAAPPGGPPPPKDVINPYSSFSLEELLNIPVATGSFLELSIEELPVTMTIISREQIKQSGARHMGELLEMFVPGFVYMVAARDVSYTGDIWAMRGVAPSINSTVLYMVNGIKLNHESAEANVAETRLGLLDDIERVEVLRGPAGLVYGSGALGGVVNVVTRTSTRTGAHVAVTGGYWHDLQVEGFATANLETGGILSVTGGYWTSRGAGVRKGRVYALTQEPAPPVPLPEGAPVDGSAWQVPGNMRLGADYRLGNFHLYSRFTRQELPSGAYYIVDAYPEYFRDVPPDAEPKLVDGEVVGPGHPLADDNVDSQGRAIRSIRTDGLTLGGSYRFEVGRDEIVTEGSFAMATHRLVYTYREDYQNGPLASQQLPLGSVWATHGERRYQARAKYLLRRVENLLVAAGAEVRFDDIGDDIEGLNFYDGDPDRPYVDDVLYINAALFAEGAWRPWSWLALHAGARLDEHTRTNVVVNPKAGVVWTPHEDHILKLFYQTSSNNGRAFDYERTYSSYDFEGEVFSERERGKLVPERVQSLELSTIHRFFDHLSVLPSLSLTQVSDMFASQALLHTINTSDYRTFVAEMEARWTMPTLDVGLNHAYQIPVATDVEPFEVERDGTVYVVRQIEEQVTEDGTHFVNIPSNITKLHAFWTPWPMVTLGTTVRLFWALDGRRHSLAPLEERGHNALDIQRKPSVRVNASVLFHLPSGFELGLYGYDLAGGARSRSSARWQQRYAIKQQAIYTVDLPTFRVTLEKDL